MPVLLKLHRALAWTYSGSEDEEARLIAGLREGLWPTPPSSIAPHRAAGGGDADAGVGGGARIAPHRRWRQADERLETLALGLGDDRGQAVAARHAFEVVRDFFFDHQNHFDAVTAPPKPAAQAGRVALGLAHG